MHPLSTAQNTLLRAGRRPKNAVQLGEQIGGYARASYASGGGGASRVPRIAGDVVAGSALTSCRAGGLRPVRGKPRF
jgi:hypothetical protein